MNQDKDPELHVFIPESSPLDPASRARCYWIAETLARTSRVEVLRLEGDPFDFLTLGFRSLWMTLRLFPALRELQASSAIFVQRGQSNLPKVLALIVLRRIAKCALVFDFDDSIFLTEPFATRLMCRASDAVTVSNAYLQGYASRYNANVRVVPTPIDLRLYSRPAPPAHDRSVIGWTGSPSNLKYLDILAEPLRSLLDEHDFTFRIITDSRWRGRIPLEKDIPYEVVDWSLDRFVSDMAAFDIGVSPLRDDLWTRGKGGYRILEYMALGIPAVASRVGENSTIIDDGVDGFLVQETAGWTQRLKQLLDHPELRIALGAAGRRKVEERYSLETIAHKVEEILTNPQGVG